MRQLDGNLNGVTLGCHQAIGMGTPVVASPVIALSPLRSQTACEIWTARFSSVTNWRNLREAAGKPWRLMVGASQTSHALCGGGFQAYPGLTQ